MIGDEDVACFAIVTHQVVETFRVGAFLNHESKINTETLKAFVGSHGVGVSTWSLAKLRSHTDIALIDGVGERQSGHATSVPVELGKPTKVQMAETLVPEHA